MRSCARTLLYVVARTRSYVVYNGLSRTIYIRCVHGCVWQGNHQIYGYVRCIFTVLANPTYTVYLWSPGPDPTHQTLHTNSTLLQYVVPAVLPADCFFWKRLESSDTENWHHIKSTIKPFTTQHHLLPISRHAGYSYSGHVMAYAYKHIDPSKVWVLEVCFWDQDISLYRDQDIPLYRALKLAPLSRTARHCGVSCVCNLFALWDGGVLITRSAYISARVLTTDRMRRKR